MAAVGLTPAMDVMVGLGTGLGLSRGLSWENLHHCPGGDSAFLCPLHPPRRRNAQAHQPDESLDLARILPTLELLRGLIRRFCLE